MTRHKRRSYYLAHPAGDNAGPAAPEPDWPPKRPCADGAVLFISGIGYSAACACGYVGADHERRADAAADLKDHERGKP